jgi:hypothetical protein
VDAEILYCMIRWFKPENIVEVGSGFSTYLIAQSVEQNRILENVLCNFSTIEPFPNVIVKTGIPGLSELIPKKIQNVNPDVFFNLKQNDILFIDSSHILDIGSDVHHIFNDILPKVNKGVIVHFHDIFLPHEYPKMWVLKKHWFWNEQYILRAFLSGNTKFRVLWAGAYMHFNYFSSLKKAFEYENKARIPPGSFWIQKK